MLVAHRGYPSKYPENSRVGFMSALEAGAEFVELDVQLSKDRIPILYHDADTMRISGVQSSLFDLTLAEIQEFGAYIPGRFGEAFQGNPVLTLAGFCDLLQAWPRARAFVEIKADSVDHFGLEETVDRVINAIGRILDRCTIISFHDRCLEYARTAHGARIGWVLSNWGQAAEERARELSPEFVFTSKNILPDGACAVWSGPWRWAVYVVDDADEANAYPDRGVSYVETDCIAEMMSHPALRKDVGNNNIQS